MLNKLIKAVFTVQEDEKTVDPSKPLGDQLQGSDRPFTVITPTQNHPPQQKTSAVSSVDKEKYDKHFTELFESANCPSPSYHEFINIAEAFSELPAATRFPKALNSFKGKLSKDVVLQTAEGTLQVVEQHTQQFNADAQKKAEDTIGKNRKLLEQKREQMLNLQKEIGDLEAFVAQAEKELESKTATFNSYAANLQNKIKQDINDIKTYL